MATSVSERPDPASQEQTPNMVTPNMATRTEDVQLTMDERNSHSIGSGHVMHQDELLSKRFANSARITETGSHVLDGNVSTVNNLSDGANNFGNLPQSDV